MTCKRTITCLGEICPGGAQKHTLSREEAPRDGTTLPTVRLRHSAWRGHGEGRYRLLLQPLRWRRAEQLRVRLLLSDTSARGGTAVG